MRVILSLICLVVITAGSVAQSLSRVSMDKGQRFIVAFQPYVQSPSEKPLPKPLLIVVRTEFEANVRIRTMDPNGSVKVDTTIRVIPTANGGVLTWSVPTSMVVSTSKRKAKVAYEVTSDVPISVNTRRLWAGGGEEVHVLPVDHLGQEYRAISMPLDAYGNTFVTGFIAVVGTVDGTKVTVMSKLKLIDPNTGSALKENEAHTLTLDAGEVMMFDHVMDTNKVHTPEQDLTGTLVTADNPVGVLSGHLKGSAFTRYRLIFPTGNIREPAHYIRNGIAEMLPPTTMADTVFAATPFMYTNERVGYKHHDSADCMVLGDIVRFVATENNTFIYKNYGGSPNRVLLGVIERGEMLTDSSLFEGASYWSSKPVLAAQYGRSYARIGMFKVEKDGGEHVQGHPLTQSGMPSMAMLVPESRWVTSAVWNITEGMDNFVSIVFRTGDAKSITYNGSPLLENNAVKVIKNTVYSQLTVPVTSVMNIVQATADGVRFNVLPQNSLDGLQQGRAMAMPTGFDVAAPGKDSIIITENMLPVTDLGCGMREVSVSIDGPNGISTIFPTARTNYRLVLNDFTPGDKNASFRVEPIETNKIGSITVRIVAASGALAERTYIYEPQPSTITATALPSAIPTGVPECFDVTIVNPGLEVLEITGLSMLKGGDLNVNTTFPITIDPAASRTVTCCLVATKPGAVKDTLIASQVCFDVPVTEVSYNVVSPNIAVDDAVFGRVDVSSEPVTMPVKILNRTGGVRMIVSDIQWLEGASDPHFTFDTTGLGLPVTLDPDASFQVPVTYDPNGDLGDHRAKIRVVSTSLGSDSLIQCSADSRVISSVNEETAAIGLHPVPVSVGGTLRATLPAASNVRVIDLQGREIEQLTVNDNGQLEINVSADRYHAGVYLLMVTIGDDVRTYRWMVE